MAQRIFICTKTLEGLTISLLAEHRDWPLTVMGG